MAERERQIEQLYSNDKQDGHGSEPISDQHRENQDRESAEGKNNDIPVWEWIVAAIGLAMVAGTICFMLYQAIWNAHSPPDVVIQVDAVNPAQGGYLVEFHAVNQGGTTAEGMIIEGDLSQNGQSIEKSQTTVDYLPAHSERRGGLFFSKDPQQFELRIRAFGYQEP